VDIPGAAKAAKSATSYSAKVEDTPRASCAWSRSFELEAKLSKLHALKLFFSLQAAANYVTSKINKEADVADLLQYALAGYLTLSIYFREHVVVQPGRVLDLSEQEAEQLAAARNFVSAFDWEHDVYASFLALSAGNADGATPMMVTNPRINKNQVAAFKEPKVVRFAGVLDLTLAGPERAVIGQMLEKFGDPWIDNQQTLDEIILVAPNNTAYQLMEAATSSISRFFGATTYADYRHAAALPLQGRLVVRSTHLDKLIALLRQVSTRRSEESPPF